MNQFRKTMRVFGNDSGFISSAVGKRHGTVFTMDASKTVFQAVANMKHRQASAVLVTSHYGTKLAGIFTERDMYAGHACATAGVAPLCKCIPNQTVFVKQSCACASTRLGCTDYALVQGLHCQPTDHQVQDACTGACCHAARCTSVFTVQLLSPTSPGSPQQKALALMQKHHFRHLPVTNKGRVTGLLDVVQLLQGAVRGDRQELKSDMVWTAAAAASTRSSSLLQTYTPPLLCTGTS